MNLWKYGKLAQGIYIDPERDFVGVYFSTMAIYLHTMKTKCRAT